MTEKVKITYRGWPGHFICANRCVFRLNTLVEYGKRAIVVSTVGLLKYHENDKEFANIGCDRLIETMAFESLYDEWNDADVSKEIDFESNWALNNTNEHQAQEMHETVVKEIAQRMIEETIKWPKEEEDALEN